MERCLHDLRNIYVRVCDISWMTEAHTLGHRCFSCSTLQVTNYTYIVYMVNMCYIIVFLYWYESSSWGTYSRSLLPQLFHLKFINHTRIVYVYAILCCKHCLYWVYITIYFVACKSCIVCILHYAACMGSIVCVNNHDTRADCIECISSCWMKPCTVCSCMNG
jgi:hypothetical protein